MATEILPVNFCNLLIVNTTQNCYVVYHMICCQPKQWCRSPHKIMICQKSKQFLSNVWTNTWKILAQMFWHIITICVFNETGWWQTPEAHFGPPNKTLFLEVTQKNTKTGVFIIFSKVCRTKIFQASLGEFGQKVFTPPKFACSYTYKPTWYDLHGRTHNLFLKKSNWMHLTEIN